MQHLEQDNVLSAAVLNTRLGREAKLIGVVLDHLRSTEKLNNEGPSKFLSETLTVNISVDQEEASIKIIKEDHPSTTAIICKLDSEFNMLSLDGERVEGSGSIAFNFIYQGEHGLLEPHPLTGDSLIEHASSMLVDATLLLVS